MMACLNFCCWECHIADAIASGGTIHQPNGLPLRCIDRNGDIWEHEHANHPDYKFLVEVEYVGPPHDLPEWDDSYGNQDHALIYTDECIAVTMYECTYGLWSLRDGQILAGNMWKPTHWKLTDRSRGLIKELFEK